MIVHSPLHITDLFRTDFRTSAEGDAVNAKLQKALAFDYRYQPARIAVALSLANSSIPPLPPDLLGKPIKGETLFGQEELDVAVWTALIVEHGRLERVSRRDIVDLVAAHWLRGAQLLWRRFSKWPGSPHSFIASLGLEGVPEPKATLGKGSWR